MAAIATAFGNQSDVSQAEAASLGAASDVLPNTRSNGKSQHTRTTASGARRPSDKRDRDREDFSDCDDDETVDDDESGDDDDTGDEDEAAAADESADEEAEEDRATGSASESLQPAATPLTGLSQRPLTAASSDLSAFQSLLASCIAKV